MRYAKDLEDAVTALAALATAWAHLAMENLQSSDEFHASSEDDAAAVAVYFEELAKH